jgi:hypothetical protein
MRLINDFALDNLLSTLIWSIIECSIGIICVSIPPIRPLFAHMFPQHFGSRNYSHQQVTRNIYVSGSVPRGTWVDLEEQRSTEHGEPVSDKTIGVAITRDWKAPEAQGGSSANHSKDDSASTITDIELKRNAEQL